MQKVVPPRLLVPYLSGRRTIISGYVYRVQDCDRLITPAALVEALDLCFDGSELTPDVPELYIMRWDARDIDTVSSGDLVQELHRALRRPQIAAVQAEIGIHHADQR